jgi:putative GTP pyrophosphokinase
MSAIDYSAPEILERAGITSEELVAIQQDFIKKSVGYEQDAEYISSVLLKTPGVHSVRYRIKDPRHLADKVVRKRLENADRKITLETYEQELTDLSGVRVLHLFKGDWQRIHNFITSTWDLKEKPTAYFRQGDGEDVLSMFKQQDCDVKEHVVGYRSVHYIIETSPTKVKRHLEIQVRTIFEEGWSEIDHKIRYPNFSDNPLTNSLLLILNRLAGSADEMSSFVQELSTHLVNSALDFKKLEEEKNEQIRKLEAIIQNPTTSEETKSTLQSVAESMTQTDSVLKKLNQPGGSVLTLADAVNRSIANSKGLAAMLERYRDPLDDLPGANIQKMLNALNAGHSLGLPNLPKMPGLSS